MTKKRNRRPLTDDERAAAAAFRRHLEAASDTRTQQQIADEIGVNPAMLYHWTTSVAITAARARDVAKAVGADPNEISVAFRTLNLPEQPVVPMTPASQFARLDRDTLHEALSLLVHDEQLAGPYVVPRMRSNRLADLYERVHQDGGRLSDASNKAFIREVETRALGGRNAAKKATGSRRR